MSESVSHIWSLLSIRSCCHQSLEPFDILLFVRLPNRKLILPLYVFGSSIHQSTCQAISSRRAVTIACGIFSIVYFLPCRSLQEILIGSLDLRPASWSPIHAHELVYSRHLYSINRVSQHATSLHTY